MRENPQAQDPPLLAPPGPRPVRPCNRDAARVQILRARRRARTLAHLLGERTSAPLCMTTARYSQAAKVEQSSLWTRDPHGEAPHDSLSAHRYLRFRSEAAGPGGVGKLTDSFAGDSFAGWCSDDLYSLLYNL